MHNFCNSNFRHFEKELLSTMNIPSFETAESIIEEEQNVSSRSIIVEMNGKEFHLFLKINTTVVFSFYYDLIK